MGQLKFKNLSFLLIPLILSIGITSSISYFDLIQDADAQQAVGPKQPRSFGSRNAGVVCGDRLCSEDEPTGQKSAWTRHTPPVPIPRTTAEEFIQGWGQAPWLDIEAKPVEAGEKMSIEVEFENIDGDIYQDVNYNIKATQGGNVVLDEKGVYDHDGEAMHQTMPLPADASSENPVNVEIEFLGYGPSELVGPTEEYETRVVPEFGTVAALILAVSIVSIIAVTARSKVIPRL